MKKAIIIGGAGFTGSALSEELRNQNYFVYNVIRPDSPHKTRLDKNDKDLQIIECELGKLQSIKSQITRCIDVMFYISWVAGTGFKGQFENISYLINAIEFAAELRCKRIVITGSQAEYGCVPKNELIVENRTPNPFTDYGAAKTAACFLSKQYAADLGIEWIWGRVFSLIGRYEPRGRMLPDLYYSLREGKDFSLSSCRQNWDYLDVHDAADALVALAERGKSGEIYNIANGNYRPLREYTEEVKKIVGDNAKIIYGSDATPFVTLQPSVEKICNHTGWKAKRCFAESIKDYE